MADSSVRKHNYEFIDKPKISQNKTNNNEVTNTKSKVNKVKVAHTAGEKIMLSLIGLTGFVAMIMLVFTSIVSTQAQQNLQSINTSITKAQNKNIDLQQDIGELINNQKLAEVAKQNNLQLSENNIRNIQK